MARCGDRGRGARPARDLVGGGHGEGGGACYLTVGLWIGASAVAALVSVQLLSDRIGAAPAYGLAAGLLFAAGDISTKAAVEAADSHLAFVAALIAAYASGTLVLQAGFQRGSALTTAGIATLLTNALPIVAGMTIFGEPLPEGWLGAVRIAAFACVVIGAVFLGERRHPAARARRPNGAGGPRLRWSNRRRRPRAAARREEQVQKVEGCPKPPGAPRRAVRASSPGRSGSPGAGGLQAGDPAGPQVPESRSGTPPRPAGFAG